MSNFKNYLAENKKIVGISLTSLIFFIYITICIAMQCSLVNYDREITGFWHSIALVYPKEIPLFITHLGLEYMPLLLGIAIIALGASRHFKELFFILLSISGGTFFVELIKNLVHRARPSFDIMLINSGDYSFPSGHSTISMCFYGAFIYLIIGHVKNLWIKRILLALLIMLILLIGFSRIYLGVHYPSDVIGGFLLGLFWLCICIMIYENL